MNSLRSPRILPVLVIILGFVALGLTATLHAQAKKPNILVIMADDIGWYNTSIYNRGDMGYQTPNIDRIGKEGGMFLSWYGQQSCTAGRAAFITGQSPIRTGLTKVGLPGADVGLSAKDPTSPRSSSLSAMQPHSSARTISATATTSSPAFTASTSSSAISTT